MKQYLIDETLVKALIAYLETKPFKEVVAIISALSKLEAVE